MFRLSISMCCILLLMPTANAAVLLSGSVVDKVSKTAPVTRVSVSAFDGSTLLAEPVQTNEAGGFELILPTFTPGPGRRVKLELMARGYERDIRIVDIKRPNVNLPDPIPLTRKPGVRLLSATMSESIGQDRIFLEFTLENANTKESVDVHTLQIAGSSSAPITCIDGGAVMTYVIGDVLRVQGPSQRGGAVVAGETRILASNGDELARRSLQGALHHRTCGISTQSLEVTYLFTLQPSERPPKLSLELPRTFRLVSNPGAETTLSWSPQTLKLVMDTGLSTELSISRAQGSWTP